MEYTVTAFVFAVNEWVGSGSLA